MEHEMRLDESPFERVRSGKKIIELRLFDEKRQGLNIGDTIVFSKRSDENQKIYTQIMGLLRYQTFADLVNDFPISYFGYPEDYDKRAYAESMYECYTKDEECQYGVLGIRIRLIETLSKHT